MTRNAVVVSPHPAARADLRRGGRDCWPRGGRRGRAGRLRAGGRGADDPADRGADGRPGDRRDRRHRRHRGRARGVPLGQPRARRRARATCRCSSTRTADPAAAAEALVDSKSFDNSILCTNESTLIAEEAIADALIAELGRRRVACSIPRQTDRIRATCYPDGRVQTRRWPARMRRRWRRRPGSRVPNGTKVLVAPFEMIVRRGAAGPREAVPAARDGHGARRPARHRGRAGAAADRRRRALGGDPLPRPGHDPRLWRRDAACCASPSTRRAATGSSGLDTNLATDDDDRHRLLRPLVADREPRAACISSSGPSSRTRSTRRAVSATSTGLQPWSATVAGAARPRPRCAGRAPGRPLGTPDEQAFREELRRLILEELREAVRD